MSTLWFAHCLCHFFLRWQTLFSSLDAYFLPRHTLIWHVTWEWGFFLSEQIVEGCKKHFMRILWATLLRILWNTLLTHFMEPGLKFGLGIWCSDEPPSSWTVHCNWQKMNCQIMLTCPLFWRSFWQFVCAALYDVVMVASREPSEMTCVILGQFIAWQPEDTRWHQQ